MDFTYLKETGGEDIDEVNIQLRKVIALDEYLDLKINSTDFVEFDGKFSIGFSDDDENNVESIRKFIDMTLKPRYPKLHFVVYNTSNPEKVEKIKI